LIHADVTASATRPAIASMVVTFAVSDIGKRGLARTDWLPVHVDGAGAAERLPAPELCSFQAKEVSDRPQERHRRVNPFQDPLLSVDGELHRTALAVQFTKLPMRPATPSQLFLKERVEHCGPLTFEVSVVLETLFKQSFDSLQRLGPG
jgi:hypothetical protein